MFFLVPFRVSERNGGGPPPLANSVLIAANVVVYLLNAWRPLDLAVGPGTPVVTVLTYGFMHAGPVHLLANLWTLWLFGNPVNRRLGNGYYLYAYLGTLVTLGVVARLLSSGPLLGASGAVFAVLLLFFLLLPRARVHLAYVALFPVTLLVGLLSRPAHWLFWLVRWDACAVLAWVGLLLVPLLEVVGLWANGWNWTNLAHLVGLFCGVAAALLLPAEVTTPRRTAAAG
jgi:membrane associated rhomboid family serine protease